MGFLDKVAATSSVLLRLFSYIFLRWIPGHPFPPIIYTLLAIYLPIVIATFFAKPAHNVLADDVRVMVVENEILDEDNEDEDEPLLSLPFKALDRNIGPMPRTHVQKDAPIVETLPVQIRKSKPWQTLLTGLPSSKSTLLNLATISINVLLTVAVTDYTYRGNYQFPSHNLSFARLGYVSSTEAKMLLREPDSKKWPISVDLRIRDAQAPSDMPGWQAAGDVDFTEEKKDFTAVLTISLRGGKQTDYEWRTSNGHSGSFKSGLPHGMKLHEKQSSHISFLTTSCIIPNFPYNFLAHPLAIPGFRHMSNLLPKLNAQFMLFLGDFIYIDVPKRFGASVEDYRRKYRQIYASPDWPLVSNLSWIHVLDDHEIANDYDLGQETTEYKSAVDPFHHYQASVNPPTTMRANTLEHRSNVTWYTFSSGPSTFFMMDTRSYRSQNHALPATDFTKSMLGPAQLTDLLAFLSAPLLPGIRWKFVVSSIPFTRNWGGPSGDDTWGGFLAERQRILEAMWEAGLHGAGVIVLSGDRHEFAATAFPPPPDSIYPESVTVHEYSTSPLSQFYLPIPTYKERGEGDKMVKYIPHGNSKLGHLNCVVEGTAERSTCTFVLYIDGVEAWRDVLLSPRIVKGVVEKAKDGILGALGGTFFTS